MHGGRLRVLGAAHPAFQQVQPIHRHAQELGTRVFDDDRLDLLPAYGDPVQAAKAADAVVHMHDGVPRSELGYALQGGGAAEAPSPAYSARAQEDLVIRQNPQTRNRVPQGESLLQRSHGELRARGQPRLPPHDLFEALNLSVVVAQNQGPVPEIGSLAQRCLQPLHVPRNGRWRCRVEDHMALGGGGEAEPGEGSQPLEKVAGGKADGAGRGRVVAALHRLVVASHDLAPGVAGGSLQVVVRPSRDKRVRRKQVEKGARRAGSIRPPAGLQPHGEQADLADGLLRSLVEDVEEAHRADLVPVELDPHRIGGAEGEDIHDAAAHRELSDLLHQRHFAEASLDELLDQRGEPGLVARAQGEMQVGEPGGKRGQLLERARRGDQKAATVAEDGLHRLDPAPLDLDLEVVALVGEGLALRIGHHGVRAKEGVQIRFGGGRLVHAGGEEHEDALRHRAGQGGGHGMSKRSRRASDPQLLTAGGKLRA